MNTNPLVAIRKPRPARQSAGGQGCLPVLVGSRSVSAAICALVMIVLAGCGGGSAASGSGPRPTPNPPAPPASPPPPPVSSVDVSHGHFFGALAIGNETHWAEMILTDDGELRLYFEGETHGDTVPEAGPALLVGAIDHTDGGGSGKLIGLNCADANPGRFCHRAADFSIVRIPSDRIDFLGEILVVTGDEDEVWSVELDWYDGGYARPANIGQLPGHYLESRAEFARGEDVVVSVDDAGRLFAQSANSGCVVNGTLAPHAAGLFSVFDAHVVVENCLPPYAQLNREFSGLATPGIIDWWWFDDPLTLWLSTTETSGPPTALSMTAYPIR